jgi:hypothetical protein
VLHSVVLDLQLCCYLCSVDVLVIPICVVCTCSECFRVAGSVPTYSAERV